MVNKDSNKKDGVTPSLDQMLMDLVTFFEVTQVLASKLVILDFIQALRIVFGVTVLYLHNKVPHKVAVSN